VLLLLDCAMVDKPRDEVCGFDEFLFLLEDIPPFGGQLEVLVDLDGFVGFELLFPLLCLTR
jgi:hypothetical protein